MKHGTFILEDKFFHILSLMSYADNKIKDINNKSVRDKINDYNYTYRP